MRCLRMNRCTFEKKVATVLVKDYGLEKRYEANVYSHQAMGELVKLLVEIINQQDEEIKDLRENSKSLCGVIDRMMRFSENEGEIKQ